MLVAVVGVGVFLHESLGAFMFAACLLTFAIAFWLGILRRFTRWQSAVRCASVTYCTQVGTVTRFGCIRLVNADLPSSPAAGEGVL
jgi:hypothetical protein